MELIMKESDRLDRIITDFLEFARLRPPSKEDVDVATLIEEVAFLLKNNAAVKSKIVTDIAHQPGCTLRVDEEQMKQVFINLAINACEAMPEGGTLSISSHSVGRSLSIAFKDEGEGITQDVRSRLFEPFFTTKEGGTGLGLAIANKIVEAHGGSIDVRNHPDGGAEVSVIFPNNVLRSLQDSLA
jgi:signal transduction histidine kinase